MWAGLWTAPVLALGLTLFTIALLRRSRGLRRAGLVLTVFPVAFGAALIFLVLS